MNHLIDVLLPGLRERTLHDIFSIESFSIDLSRHYEYFWPSDQRRLRRWNLGKAERKVLIALYRAGSQPKNRNELTLDSPKIQYVQVDRAVKSLIGRGAIEIRGSGTWREKPSPSYVITPFGRFFLEHHELSEGVQKDCLSVLKALDDVATHRRWDFLSDLTQSVMSICDTQIRRKHAKVLVDMARYHQENLGEPSWKKAILSEFIRQAWVTMDDISAYRHIPNESRRLLELIREMLREPLRRIDDALSAGRN
jgi:hypothetical protein